MPDYVVLKRLTLKSELGWFKSVFVGHGLKTRQKGITLNKGVIHILWPSLLIRMDAYERYKEAQDAAEALGSAGQAAFEAMKAAAKVVGTIPIDVELHGPGGKPPMQMNQIIALQDKNWRLNGNWVIAPPGDPARFYPVMQEGDLALIGFDDVGWPANSILVLLSQSADANLWADLQTRVTKGHNSMVQVDQADLVTLANAHGLPVNHVIRALATTSSAQTVPPPTAPPAPGSSPTLPGPAMLRSASRRPRWPSATSKTTPSQLAANLAAAALVGQLGEKLVDAYLASQGTPGESTHTWISQTFAAHPYDFECLSMNGAVIEVIDAKSTSQLWTADFYMSAAEVAYAAASPVSYRIYRVSKVAAGTSAELRISDDIRPLAAAIESSSLASAQVGTRVTSVAVAPQGAGITWTGPIALPPVPP